MNAGLVVERVEAGREAAGPEDADAARRHEVVAQVVAERDEVDEVVGVEVADDDRVDVLGSTWRKMRGNEPCPRSSSTRVDRPLTRYAAPVAPSRSV